MAQEWRCNRKCVSDRQSCIERTAVIIDGIESSLVRAGNRGAAASVVRKLNLHTMFERYYYQTMPGCLLRGKQIACVGTARGGSQGLHL